MSIGTTSGTGLPDRERFTALGACVNIGKSGQKETRSRTAPDSVAGSGELTRQAGRCGDGAE